MRDISRSAQWFRTAIRLILVLAAAQQSHSVFAAIATPITLQQPTATFSQSAFGDYSVGTAINGTDADNLGWAIANGFAQSTGAQTAVFETSANVGFLGGSIFTFTMIQTHTGPSYHTLGRFRLSVTTDDRSLFADGLATGGDVTANWIVLNPGSFISANGATLTKLGDFSILASGLSPEFDTYTISAQTTLTGITGIRLEALADPSLPFGGPGRQPENGNFVLAEFQVDITPIPEPTVFSLLVAVGIVRLVVGRKNRLNAVQ